MEFAQSKQSKELKKNDGEGEGEREGKGTAFFEFLVDFYYDFFPVPKVTWLNLLSLTDAFFLSFFIGPMFLFSRF